MVRQISISAHPGDLQTFGHHVSAFNTKFKERVSLTDLRKDSPEIKVHLKECANKPNNLQFAVAQAALELLQKYVQQVHIVKGGQGKSRIAAVTAFLALETRAAEKVHLVYTN